jgi:hypothetical protein
VTAARSLSDAVTESFYAWETRGRGWMLADYPVSLEPPFRPLFLLPGLAPDRFERIDDGKRPTIASSLLDGAKRLFSRTPPATETEPYAEQAPFQAFERGPLTTVRILVPIDFALRPEVMAQLLGALGAATHPLSFELIGIASRVVIQLVCGDIDARDVRAHVEAFMPEAAVIPEDDLLAEHWSTTASHVVVDFGLSQEYFLPLASMDGLRVDPYASLIHALARAKHGEFIALQILFERVRNPWTSAINDALDDGDGGCLIEDAQWFLSAAKEKTRTPLHAALLRVGAQAQSEERALDLLQGTQAFLLQYENSAGNALTPLSNDGYPDAAHAWALVERESFRTGMLLSADELVALCHLPDQSVRHPALLRARERTKALPAAACGHELILGEHHHRGVKDVATLDLESRFAHTWILGGSGTGKSTLLANLVLQDIEAGHGVAVLDPHGDLIDDIVARIPEERVREVILFDPADAEYPIGFNILDARTEIERNLLASDLVAIFRRFATSWGDTMSTVLNEAVLALLLHPEGGTLIDLKRFLVDKAFREGYLDRILDPDLRSFWSVEYPLIGTRSLGPLLSRLDTFLRSRIVRNIVGQSGAKLDLGEAMRTGKVVLARLAKGLIGEENSALLGSLLVAKFNQLTLARQEISKDTRRSFFCYADEFQHFVTPSMESLATEGRKYRFGLTLAHQTFAQLADVPKIESALLANCHTRIVFRVGEGDARKLAEGFAFFEASDLTRLGRGESIARIGGAANDFNLRTLPLPSVEAVESERIRGQVVTHARERYALPRANLVEQLAPAHSAADDKPRAQEASDESVRVERVLPLAPGPSVSAPTRTPDAAPRARTQRPSSPKSTDVGRGGAMHRYLQHLVKRLAEERGFRAVIEDAALTGRADVVLHRDEIIVGCEISITTDAEHEGANLKKCLAAGFARVLFVSPEKRQRERVIAMIRADLPGAPIDVIGPEDIVTALDALGAAPTPSESVVRGYKVKVTRQDLSPNDVIARRKAVAEVIARGLRK